jgi:hypothetical protein
MERRKQIAWSVAASTCVETREDPVMIYNRILAKWDKADKNGQSALHESYADREK